MTLDRAEEEFEAALNGACHGEPKRPTNQAAGVYLTTLLEYEADDMIGDDTFRNGLAKIAAYLME